MKKLLATLFGANTSAAPATAFHPTRVCPECGTKLSRSAGSPEAEWGCPNLDCPARLRERLTRWCSAEGMDIAGVDAALVAKLVKTGLAYDVAELYRMKLKELAALEGMESSRAQQIYDGITASMKRDGWRMLFGLSIPLVEAAEAQALCSGIPSVDAVFAAGAPCLMNEGGVSQAVAESILGWHSDSVNRRLVKRLEKIGLNFKSEQSDSGTPSRL